MDVYKTLYDAIKKHASLEDAEIIDAGNHGADTGWSGFTYTADCVEFYDDNHDAIWELLKQSADDQGMKPLELVSHFNRADMAESYDGFANLLAWFALEEVGHWLETNPQTPTDEEEGDNGSAA